MEWSGVQSLFLFACSWKKAKRIPSGTESRFNSFQFNPIDNWLIESKQLNRSYSGRDVMWLDDDVTGRNKWINSKMSNDWWYQMSCNVMWSDQIRFIFGWMDGWMDGLIYLTALLGGERWVEWLVQLCLLCDANANAMLQYAMLCLYRCGFIRLDWLSDSRRKKEYGTRYVYWSTSLLFVVHFSICFVLLCLGGVTWRDSSLTSSIFFILDFIHSNFQCTSHVNNIQYYEVTNYLPGTWYS